MPPSDIYLRGEAVGVMRPHRVRNCYKLHNNYYTILQTYNILARPTAIQSKGKKYSAIYFLHTATLQSIRIHRTNYCIFIFCRAKLYIF